jgi:hypothetical protein
METSDLLEVAHHPVKEEWRSVTTTSGALSVMTHGTIWMPVLLASKWATAMKVISEMLHLGTTNPSTHWIKING